jgi:hypothetical protein
VCADLSYILHSLDKEAVDTFAILRGSLCYRRYAGVGKSFICTKGNQMVPSSRVHGSHHIFPHFPSELVGMLVLDTH